MAISITASVTSLLGATVPVFDAGVTSSMAVYWGQGANQDRLIETCKNNAFDIINIGFVNTFPDATGYPGANFGNQCANTTYTVDGTATQLPNDCPYIEEDIILCQEMYGKKILLSIGGAAPTDYYLESESEAIQFADFLWGAFGPNNDNDYPRPFGSAVVDGFDFDIESSIDTTTSVDVPAAYKSQYYADMVNHFRGACFDNSKTFYISGSPQCSFPDAHLADAVANAEFDFLFVQLYNTPACNARAELDGESDTFRNWLSEDFLQSQSANPSVKIFMGLPASPSGAPSDPTAYLTPAEASALLAKYSATSSSNFGGVMLWEATLD
ncbi:glycoside hydrolase family 18 protein, partial [Saccharata proteae CBS 121410]